MKLLLDTHTLIWFYSQNALLSSKARILIGTSENEKYVSIVSFWEIAIKQALGKTIIDISLDELYKSYLATEGILLPIDIDSIRLLESLPQHHRDPFDRMLIAQAKKHELTIVSRDPKFLAYEVPVLW
jgi:PIN domain nuclease of toxin-antitoxin system